MILLSDYACNPDHLLFGPEHTDIDTTETPVTGSTLVYDEIDQKWHSFNVMVAAGYGGIRHAGVPIPLPDIGAGFNVIPADAALLANPSFVDQDFPQNALEIQAQGVWVAYITISLVHNESPGGRSTNVQVYDATTATPGLTTRIPIGRNSPGTYFPVSIMVEISPADIGNIFQVRVGGGDSLTDVFLHTYQFSISHVSEWSGT